MPRKYTSHKRRLVTEEEIQRIRKNKPCHACGHIRTDAELARELGFSPTTIHRYKDYPR